MHVFSVFRKSAQFHFLTCTVTAGTVPTDPMHNPTALSEFEPYVDTILVEYGVERTAVSEILRGDAEPSALRPNQLPRGMTTVKVHCEDTPFNLIPYTDTEGHTCDFDFGMSWSGVIRDAHCPR